jgi:hypothetical protein
MVRLTSQDVAGRSSERQACLPTETRKLAPSNGCYEAWAGTASGAAEGPLWVEGLNRSRGNL